MCAGAAHDVRPIPQSTRACGEVLSLDLCEHSAASRGNVSRGRIHYKAGTAVYARLRRSAEPSFTLAFECRFFEVLIFECRMSNVVCLAYFTQLEKDRDIYIFE